MILLDTHAWIWHLADSGSLSPDARRSISEQTRDHSIFVSAVSVWELFMLVKKGRLELNVAPASFLSVTRRDPLLSFVSVDERIARRSVELPDIHTDPADRMIIATAIELGVGVVTCDSRFREYGLCSVVW